MTNLSWKLARLSVMTPAEIAHRAHILARDRVAPPSYARWSPPEAFARLFEGDAHTALAASRLPALVAAMNTRVPVIEAEVAAAQALMDGRWRLFGREVRLDDPPHWSANPLSGQAWPDAPSARLDYHDVSIAGDPKEAWELGRLTVLHTLALAARVTGDSAYADRALHWLGDFTRRNPLGRGIHHTSGIEQAIRVLTVSWTLALLGNRAQGAALEPALGLLAQQALHVRDHLSLGSSANNHLIAEYSALATMGALFPTLRGAPALMNRGMEGLEREVMRQFDSDGVSLEQSFGYVPFIWELLLTPFLAAAAAGRPVSAEARQRVASSLGFMRTVRLPDGQWPRIGDEDDGRVLWAGSEASRLDVVGNAVTSWLGASASDGTPVRTLTRQGACYTVRREGELLVTFDHGPLGLEPLAAHGNADALSVTIHHGGDAIVVDPGTFAYHTDREARDRCRSTRSHATLHFGDASQARMRGPFLWQGVPHVTRVGDAWQCRWASGEVHRRSVSVTAGQVVIDDTAERGSAAALSFPLAPGAQVTLEDARAHIT
ncbi:MAG: heparinase II/III domain-containing protein, partial [Candidatus Eiseniibacteriota bacterium]